MEARLVGKWRGDVKGSGGETVREVVGRRVGKWRGDM